MVSQYKREGFITSWQLQTFFLLWEVKGEGTISLLRKVKAEWAASPHVLGNSDSAGRPLTPTSGSFILPRPLTVR